MEKLKKCMLTMVMLLCALTVFGNEQGVVHAQEEIYLYLHSNYGTDRVAKWDITNRELGVIRSTIYTPSFSRKGYLIDRYTEDKAGYIGNIEPYTAAGGVILHEKPTSSLNLYAQWKAIKYEITYECNGGTNNELNPATYTIESDITLAEPIRVGYDFTGWYLDEDLTDKVTSIKDRTENITLYAGWKCNHTSGSPKLKNYKEATCCEDGYSGDECCIECGEIVGKGIVVPATGKHETTVTGAKEATCQEEGNTGNTYCVTSGKLLSTGEVIPKKAHDKVVLKNQKEATCHETGYTGDKYCSVCDTLQEAGQIIPTTEHKWNNGVITKEPTKEDTGIRTFTCTSCGHTREEILPVIVACDHIHTSVKNQKEATCKQEGYSGDTYCTDCGALVSIGTVIEANENHKWNDGEITKYPTATEEGVKTYTCTVCGKTKTMLILPTGTTTTEQTTTENTSTEQSTETVTKEETVKKVSSLKLKNKKSCTVTVTFKKVKGAKYQLQYSTKKNFKNAKKKNLTKTSYKIAKLKKGKTYYVRVRAYKKENGKTYYGKWTTKKIKIKK